MKTCFKTVIATALFAGIMLTGSAAFASNNGMQNGLGNGNNINQKSNPSTMNCSVGNQNGQNGNINYGQSISLENRDINALLQLARLLDIHSTGLSKEQLIAAITEKLQQGVTKQQYNNGNQQNQQNQQFQQNQQCNNGYQQGQNGLWAVVTLTQLLDIDTSDLDGDEIVDAIVAELDDLSASELLEAAEAIGIDTDDLSESEIVAAIEDELDNADVFCNSHLEQIASLLSIATSDLDEDEIVDAIEDELDDLSASKLLEVAAVLGIDTDDLSESEIIDAIEDKLEDSDFDSSYDRSLEQAATLLSIDTSDLDESEVIEAISDELDDLSVANLVKLSNIFGIDISGMTTSEIIDAIEDVLSDL